MSLPLRITAIFWVPYRNDATEPLAMWLLTATALALSLSSIDLLSTRRTEVLACATGSVHTRELLQSYDRTAETLTRRRCARRRRRSVVASLLQRQRSPPRTARAQRQPMCCTCLVACAAANATPISRRSTRQDRRQALLLGRWRRRRCDAPRPRCSLVERFHRLGFRDEWIRAKLAAGEHFRLRSFARRPPPRGMASSGQAALRAGPRSQGREARAAHHAV